MFKVGDRIYHILFGKYGEVVKEDHEHINIMLDGEGYRYSLTKEGKENEFHKSPVIVFAHQVKDVVIPRPKNEELKKTYAYYLDDETVSEEYTDIKKLCESALDEIVPKDWKIYKDKRGSFILLTVAETIDYKDRIDAEHFVEILMNDAFDRTGFDADWYLEDVDTENLKEELEKFWEEYKKKNKIQKIYYCEKENAVTYKVYIKEYKDYGNCALLSYESVKY